MITPQEVIRIGTITRPHGKQGEVQCLMQNECWDNADATFLILNIQNILTPFRVVDWRGKGSDSLIFSLAGVDSEQKAQQLIGIEAFMLRKDIQEDSEELPTWQSLTGYRVVDTDQGELGVVTEVDESTINTLLTLSCGKMIPIHEDFIVALEPDRQTLTIRLPYLL